MGERAGFPRQEGLYKAWLEDPKTQLFFFFPQKDLVSTGQMLSQQEEAQRQRVSWRD